MEKQMTDNDLIADFIGDERQKFDWNYLYDTSWDCLMPAIEKICKLWRENVDQYNTPPPEQREWDRQGSKVGMLSIDCGIKAAHIVVVGFIKWHNKQK